MKYNSICCICCICGHQTPPSDNVVESSYIKADVGFVQICVQTLENVNSEYHGIFRTLNFCPSCSKKSYTIEELKTIGNYNQWSY